MMMAIKKEGADIPVMLANTAVVSSQVPRFIAASVPNRIPKIVANNMAAVASSNVPGSASINTVLTFFFVW